MTADALLRRVADELEVRELLARYSRGVDRADWDLLRSCFSDDAELDYGQVKGSPDEFIEFARSGLAAMTALLHKQGQSWLRIDGATGVGETYVTAYHRMPAAGDGSQDLIVGARYVDRFARRDDRWLIVRRTMVYDWTTLTPVPAQLDDPTLVVGRRDRNDPSYEILQP